MLARIDINYYDREKLKNLPPEEYKAARAIIDDLPEDQTAAYWAIGDCIVDLNEAGPLLSKYGVKFEVKKFKGQISLGGPVPTLAGQPVHVHIPNVGLLSVTEVTWLEDCCTEKLQEHLDKGWRILAVCPPNCQRRPDYILGRAKSE